MHRAPGQGYVALSRFEDLGKVQLLWTPSKHLLALFCDATPQPLAAASELRREMTALLDFVFRSNRKAMQFYQKHSNK